MPLNGFTQPEYIPVAPDLRLRRYDGNYSVFLSGYQDPVVYENSEGIFDTAKIPDLSYVQRMCSYLAKVGELYYIEYREEDSFIPIGDVTIKPENPLIAIWYGRYRGMGIGKKVMETVMSRLQALGYAKITGSTVYSWNIPSQKLHEKLGFVCVAKDNKEITYERIL